MVTRHRSRSLGTHVSAPAAKLGVSKWTQRRHWLGSWLTPDMTYTEAGKVVDSTAWAYVLAGLRECLMKLRCGLRIGPGAEAVV